jgi:ABC-type nitrate/sulfonate/bicarbonate transport system permease component
MTTASEVAVPEARPAGWRAWIGPEALARIIAGLAIVAVWEIAVQLWGPAFVARPSRIVLAIPNVLADPALWQAAGQTLGAVVQGLGIAIVLGTVIGLAIGRIPVVERLLQIYVNGLFAMPMVAILPLLTLYFGYTGDARLATVVFAAIFAIVVNVSDGARAVPPEFIEVSRSFRGSGWSRLFDVVLPSSVPYLLAGIKLAGGRALIGAVIAEFYAAIPGLGYYILFNTRTFRHDEAFVAVAILALTGVLIELTLNWSTRRFMPWYRRDERPA